MHRPFHRREVLALGAAGAASVCLSPLKAMAQSTSPQSVQELWADFDPRRDPLEVEVIREWKADGAVFRHVRYVVGTFKGKVARMTAIYGFPESNQKLPAVMHIHGGGQRGSLSEVQLLVARGYATLSVNWGGSAGQTPFNSVEGALPGDPNTDWGAVDPSQLNVQGYSSMLAGPKQFFDDREHPKNNNWYLLTIGCRRGLTFLEQQSEVDPQRLGVHGYSMGGNLTMYVAGTDSRVKVAVPAVGGQGWRWEPHEFTRETARAQDQVKGSVEVFRRTLSFESYAPLIRCPVLHRSSTNDFHGWMDDVYRTNRLIPDQPTRYSWAPHLNHRLTPEVAVTMPLWLDQHLKGGPKLPETPESELKVDPADHLPVLRVATRHAWPVARCEIYYSVDSDPRTRFWRSASVTRDGQEFRASLPLHSLESPLFAFANMYYSLPTPESMKQIPGMSEPIREVCLSSQLHSMTAAELRAAGTLATQSRTMLIDDFQLGLRDWYLLNGGHVSLRQAWTRKLTDPLWRGVDGTRLKFTLKMPRTNRLTFVVMENEWRGVRGGRKTYQCVREIPGSDEAQSITLDVADFVNTDETIPPLKTWNDIDQFAICAHFAERGRQVPASQWSGPAPEFLQLEWVN